VLVMTLLPWLQTAVLDDLDEVIVLDADDNRVTSSHDDVSALPTKLVSCRFG